MFDAATDHQVITFGSDTMGLYESGAISAPLVTATRNDGMWTVHADGLDDITTADRGAALDAMKSQALLLPGAKGGYSTMIPNGLRAQP